MREGLESDIRELQLKLLKAEVGIKYVRPFDFLAPKDF
jgi:hypothetical protein